MCCIKMVEEKEEINTSVVGLYKLLYFPWMTAIVLSAKSLGSISVAVGLMWVSVQVVVDLSRAHLG